MKYTEGNYEYDINIRADKSYREQAENVSNLEFMNTRGESIRLSQFADISLGIGPNRLERFDRNSSVTLRSQVFGVPAGAVSKEFMAKIENIHKPKGLRMQAVGDMKKMSDSMSVLTTALMLSLLRIYLSMVLLYNNWDRSFCGNVLYTVFHSGSYTRACAFQHGNEYLCNVGISDACGIGSEKCHFIGGFCQRCSP